MTEQTNKNQQKLIDFAHASRFSRPSISQIREITALAGHLSDLNFTLLQKNTCGYKLYIMGVLGRGSLYMRSYFLLLNKGLDVNVPIKAKNIYATPKKRKSQPRKHSDQKFLKAWKTPPKNGDIYTRTPLLSALLTPFNNPFVFLLLLEEADLTQKYENIIYKNGNIKTHEAGTVGSYIEKNKKKESSCKFATMVIKHKLKPFEKLKANALEKMHGTTAERTQAFINLAKFYENHVINYFKPSTQDRKDVIFHFRMRAAQLYQQVLNLPAELAIHGVIFKLPEEQYNQAAAFVQALKKDEPELCDLLLPKPPKKKAPNLVKAALYFLIQTGATLFTQPKKGLPTQRPPEPYI
jgi:hypothetical protein